MKRTLVVLFCVMVLTMGFSTLGMNLDFYYYYLTTQSNGSEDKAIWIMEGPVMIVVVITDSMGAITVDGDRPYVFVKGSDGSDYNLWVNWWSGSKWTWTNQNNPGNI